MFDMTNPNIYKGLIPPIIATGAMTLPDKEKKGKTKNMVLQKGGQTEASKVMNQYYQSQDYYNNASGRVEQTASPIDALVMNPIGFGKSFMNVSDDILAKLTSKISDDAVETLLNTLGKTAIYTAPFTTGAYTAVNFMEPSKTGKKVSKKTNWLDNYDK
jgi:hypothetical protein